MISESHNGLSVTSFHQLYWLCCGLVENQIHERENKRITHSTARFLLLFLKHSPESRGLVQSIHLRYVLPAQHLMNKMWVWLLHIGCKITTKECKCPCTHRDVECVHLGILIGSEEHACQWDTGCRQNNVRTEEGRILIKLVYGVNAECSQVIHVK